jgi:hypothetical protein
MAGAAIFHEQDAGMGIACAKSVVSDLSSILHSFFDFAQRTKDIVEQFALSESLYIYVSGLCKESEEGGERIGRLEGIYARRLPRLFCASASGSHDLPE